MKNLIIILTIIFAGCAKTECIDPVTYNSTQFLEVRYEIHTNSDKIKTAQGNLINGLDTFKFDIVTEEKIIKINTILIWTPLSNQSTTIFYIKGKIRLSEPSYMNYKIYVNDKLMTNGGASCMGMIEPIWTSFTLLNTKKY